MPLCSPASHLLQAIRARAADGWPIERPSMNCRVEKISERRSYGEIGQRRKDHGRHPPRCAPTRAEWIAAFCYPIRRHAIERAARRPELVERPIIYGICHLRRREDPGGMSRSVALSRPAGRGARMIPFTRTVDAATDQGSVPGASRISEGFLRAHQAATPPSLSAGPCQART